MNEKQDGVGRREFLRRAAIAGGVAWAAPIIQTVAATPAYAQSLGTPRDCFKSGPGSCMEACTSVCDQLGMGGNMSGEACNGVDPDPCNTVYGGQGPCQFFCPSGQGGDNPCCNRFLCEASNFTCTRVICDGREVPVAIFTGPTTGC
jgi:hypothetical protein